MSRTWLTVKNLICLTNLTQHPCLVLLCFRVWKSIKDYQRRYHRSILLAVLAWVLRMPFPWWLSFYSEFYRWSECDMTWPYWSSRSAELWECCRRGCSLHVTIGWELRQLEIRWDFDKLTYNLLLVEVDVFVNGDLSFLSLTENAVSPITVYIYLFYQNPPKNWRILAFVNGAHISLSSVGEEFPKTLPTICYLLFINYTYYIIPFMTYSYLKLTTSVGKISWDCVVILSSLGLSSNMPKIYSFSCFDNLLSDLLQI